MSLKRFVSAKIHDITVSEKSVDYQGSVGVANELLEAVDISPYEEVQVVNFSNGQRWTTYVIPEDPGVFSLNGGGARLGEIGDRCCLITYNFSEAFTGTKVIFCNRANTIDQALGYELENP